MPTTTLRATSFANQRLAAAGVECLTVSELRRRVPPRQLAEPERVEFFMLLVVHEGRGEHIVDFERLVLRAGRVLFVRPGQAQQWMPAAGYQGEIVLVDPAAVLAAPAAQANPAIALLRLGEWPSSFELDADSLQALRRLAALLRRELEPPEVTAVSAALARELLLCILLVLSRPATAALEAASSGAHKLAVRAQVELERCLGARPSVSMLAQRLGVSPTTLSRACRQQLGRSAKTMIDRRVALEAQRLLVHTTGTAVEIGEQLGFSEPTNFGKFFRRIVRTTPERFRQAHQLAAPARAAT